MHSPLTSSLLALTLLAGPALSQANLNCEKIRIDGHNFNLKSLGGPHSVVTTRYESIPQTHINTTYTLDICSPLKKSGEGKKNESCPNGTRVCAIQHVLSGETDTVSEVIPIAGNLESVGGKAFDYKVTRLKTSDSNSDSKKEGLRLELLGGNHPLDGRPNERRPQRAIIELLCDQDKKGTEGEWDAKDKYEAASKLQARDDNKDGKDGKDGDDKKGDDEKGDDKKGDDTESTVEHQLRKPDTALLWESYHQEGDADVLRMTWYTEAACEKRDDKNKGDGEESTASHWGFFTWFVIIVFLGIAAYLIFGSWLNYNRYGARGWDLLPHGDTIRDIPYLLKDWTRRVLNTVQGAGSRGGYSAV